MGTTIQLITEPLYQKQLRKKLIETGFAAQIFKLKEEEKSLSYLSGQVLIVQAHMWSDVRDVLKNSVSVVMFGTISWFHCWFKARSEYASAYVTPLDTTDSIISSLECVFKGKHFLSETVKELLSENNQTRQEHMLNICLSSHFTVSELEVLALISEGYTTSEIAEKRFRSVHTIKTQRKQIRKKMGAVNRERLAVFAGRKMHALKTLLLIEQNIKVLDKV